MDTRIDFLKKTETGVITDAMTLVKTGGWMRGIHPVNPGMKIAGRAFTVKFDYVSDPSKPYIKHMFHLFEYFKPGDVLVIAAKENGAITGEHVIHGAMNAGYEGMVIDGFVRDYGGIGGFDFPTFCGGAEIGHAPGNFKPVAVNLPILCGGMEVNPGDYITGDIDGVIAIPESKIDAVIYQAEKIVGIEAEMLRELNARCDPSVFLALSKEKKVPRE